MAIYPVILCGGSGSRLWPASRPARPKQFIDLISDLSLFQETVRRVAPLADGGRIVVVAGAAHRGFIEAQMSALGVEGDLILEPVGRDSAPAMAAAALWIEQIDPDGTALFVASDHYVPDAPAFREAMIEAVAAASLGRIVTMGMVPTSASSAYGYIQPFGPGLAQVGRFEEKPGRIDAERYLGEGYLWNSGNFVAPVRTLLADWGIQAEPRKLKADYFATRVLSQREHEAVGRLLTIFAEHLSLMSNQITVQQANAEPPLIVRAKEFIQQHQSEEISLGQVARAVNTSTFYFCKMFKKVTGLNFTEYVSRVRIENAKNLLLNPNLRVSEIAYEVGFQSLTHFNRVFKKIAGQSPTVYRGHLTRA